MSVQCVGACCGCLRAALQVLVHDSVCVCGCACAIYCEMVARYGYNASVCTQSSVWVWVLACLNACVGSMQMSVHNSVCGC
jgi:hypothetical protein